MSLLKLSEDTQDRKACLQSALASLPLLSLPLCVKSFAGHEAMPLLSFLGLMDVEFSASLIHGRALRKTTEIANPRTITGQTNNYKPKNDNN